MNNDKITSRVFLLALLGTPISQSAIDIYLPSFPAIVAQLHTTPGLVQLSLTLYMLTYGLSQFFYGPLSDSFGRRRVLLVGLGIFLVGTVMSMLSVNIQMLLTARFIQGLGSGSTFLLTTAALGDIFSGKKLARAITFTSLAWSTTPILAPMIGGLLQQYANWRATFLVLLVYTGAIFVLLWRTLPETHPVEKRQTLHLWTILKQIGSMMTHRVYMGYVLIVAASYGAVIAFSIIAPFILQDQLHIIPVIYGVLILIVGLFYSFGTLVNSQLLKHFTLKHILVWGVALTLLSGIVLWLVDTLSFFSVSSILIPTFILLFGQGFIFANCLTSGMETFPERRGSASSLFACLALLGITLVTAVSAKLHIHTQLGVAYLYMVLGGVAVVGFLLTR
jgi:MFS transporter, DHA1 family, 2-module integral membrane pump EmrD